ncbi:right-handed parallel beta-helix repeat-containing protein [Tessaracoccus sp. OS52]|uniref:right-handed parallel beta-helix repeat-containing protein n=1 Tax=Tessaracoccus sp. OS52 TaxID=2886691 RepID=UPI001D1160F9|nr:right-handed parallel beta-helix repeat-containing protein [Tessaracoccus sp. OS52]MCC2591873.1 right-handed parallel beta-helix repeat-containing protein [Tessaracoccus sp. OS52]
MPTERVEIHVAPDGSAWADGSRGYPVGDLHAAMRLVRARREPGQRAVVWLDGGLYRQSETLVLDGDDSFTTFAAVDPDARPVISGAVTIGGWRPVRVNGVDAWAAPAPRKRGRCLFVDGERAPRPRFPVEGYLWIEEQAGLDPAGSFVGTLLQGADNFTFADGDLPPIADPGQVEVVVPHYWVQERMPVTGIDRERRLVQSSLRSIFALRDDAVERYARYWLDNVAETFGARDGQWYLDPTGSLADAAGETILLHCDGDPGERDVEFPVLDVFVELAGAATRPVREIRFEGIAFAGADFAEVPAARAPFGVREDPMLPRDVGFAADVQAASSVPGAIRATHARSCALVDCRVERVGGYAVELGPGCRGNLISGCTFEDLGAGAVRSGGSDDPRAHDFNRDNSVCDNEIVGGGRSYPNCVAILFQHGSHNVIAHNHIADFYYSGISVGWTWDYGESPSQGNRVIGNHIHHLGQGRLNDMGGIYLLGIAPGTELRGNHIHDVRCANYGGWGIYLDEGSSHVVVEGNIVHDVSSHAFHQHYGRENILRNNVLAFGGAGQVSITRPEATVSFTCERNILVGDGGPGFVGTEGALDVTNYRVISDLNLFWDLNPQESAVRAGVGLREHDDAGEVAFVITRGRDAEWHADGHDHHSLTADPGFVDVDARDFRVAGETPATRLGIVVPDVSDAGPRPVVRRRHPLAGRTLREEFPRAMG